MNRDPIEELVMLCRGAAEAGEDWRSRLREVWLPGAVTAHGPVFLGQALQSWGGGAGDDLEGGIERVVVEALAEYGYD